MTRRSLGPCQVPGCGVLTRQTHCPQHRRRGRSPAWAQLRRAVLAADPRCAVCGRRAVEVDHIRPLAQGGAELDPANCQALCRPCHWAKTAREL